jgi:hypothetical protein
MMDFDRIPPLVFRDPASESVGPAFPGRLRISFVFPASFYPKTHIIIADFATSLTAHGVRWNEPHYVLSNGSRP